MKHSFVVFLFIILLRSAFAQTPAKPFVLGEILEIQSIQLNEKRILNIYLPEGYNPSDTVIYPVIYLLDGSADEDFIHVAGLVQFNNFSWVNRTPKSIVVGIANVDRRRDFTFPTHVEADLKKYPTTGHSDKFITFVEKELQPFIEKKYKTNGTKTLIGQSLGGLLGLEILLKKPWLFSKYIIISPSLWWDNRSLLTTRSPVFGYNFSLKTDVYIGVGREGLTPGASANKMEDDAKEFADKLNASPNKNMHTYFDYLPNEDHATAGHQAIYNAFLFLYPSTKK